LKNLVAFIQTVKCGQFSTAAARLGVTPSAISKSIARLEKDLGVRLFHRTTHHLHLTSEGSEFFDKVCRSINEIDQAADDIRRVAEEPKGQLRVAVEGNFGRYCLLPQLADFFKRYPQIDLELNFTDTAADWLDHGIDVCIRHGNGGQTRCVSRRLPFDYPIMALASPAYLALRGIPRTPDDLAEHNCIGASMLRGSRANWRLALMRSAPESSKMPADSRFLGVPKARLSTVGGYHGTDIIAALCDIGICFAPIPAALPYLEAGILIGDSKRGNFIVVVSSYVLISCASKLRLPATVAGYPRRSPMIRHAAV